MIALGHPSSPSAILSWVAGTGAAAGLCRALVSALGDAITGWEGGSCTLPRAWWGGGSLSSGGINEGKAA